MTDSPSQQHTTESDSEPPSTVFLPPYRHELRGSVKPLADVLTARHQTAFQTRFQSLLDELESLLTHSEVPRENPVEVYCSTVKQCRDDPSTVTDRELARAVAAMTVATQTDVLGVLSQYLGRTAEQYFDQYFTPPNVAAALAAIGTTTRTHFEPPSPTLDTVSGDTTLSMFTDHDTDDETQSGPDADSTAETGASPSEETVFFDPACGSGRLLLAAARQSSDPPVVLGWELEREAAQMAALTLALLEIPGWIVTGDAIHLSLREVTRITPDAESPLQCFRSFSPADVPALPSSRPAHPQDYEPLTALTSTHSLDSVAQAITELSRTLERGVDQTVVNPPFSSRDLEDDAPVVNRTHADYDTATDPPGRNTTTLRRSQGHRWLFTELALQYTRSDGAVSLVVPTSMLGNPSEQTEREWLLDTAFYESAFELPPEAFAPETTTGTSLISLVPKQPSHVGLEINHQIFMATVDTVGHDSRATCEQLVHKGTPVSQSPHALPAFYRTHVWRGVDTIPVPDDELLPAVRNHRTMRTEDTPSQNSS